MVIVHDLEAEYFAVEMCGELNCNSVWILSVLLTFQLLDNTLPEKVYGFAHEVNLQVSYFQLCTSAHVAL